MRLKKIKVAGFKSFIDPINILVPSDINAIVGPNGCGKSNIVDAVRWVLGSSAKHLRSEITADVIFNGSQSRHAASAASAELVLDNSDGQVKGPYGNYSEISIKRTITRDQQSSYYLNGQICRRKDITGLLHGTGLNPRSYAIIEQGLIAKLIGAKPEELRVYIEEAAGVSNYKERRQETETRIKRTRENLSRLNDIRIEHLKQLEALQEQARIAGAYSELRQQQRLLKGQLSGLRWEKLDKLLKKQLSLIQQQEVNLTTLQSKYRQLELISEEKCHLLREAREQLSSQQSNYYQFETNIVRLEGNISSKEQLYQEWQQNIKQSNVERKSKYAAIEAYENQVAHIKQDLDATGPQYEVLKQAIQSNEMQLGEVQQAIKARQQKWEEFNTNEANNNQKTFEAKTKIHFLAQRLTNIQREMDKLQAENDTSKINQIEQQLIKSTAEQNDLLSDRHEVEAQLEVSKNNIKHHRHQEASFIVVRDKIVQQLQVFGSDLTSLTTLQEVALGQQDNEKQTWLTDHSLMAHPCIAQSIKVQAGWELAVEVVLGDYLQAIGVGEYQAYVSKIDVLKQSNVLLINENFRPDTVSNVDHENLLVSKISTTWTVIKALTRQVFVAETLTEAVRRLPTLKPGCAIVTRDGVWLNHYSIKVVRGKSQRLGIVKREQQISQLNEAIDGKRNELASVEKELTAVLTSLSYDEDQVSSQHEKCLGLEKQLQGVMTQIEVQRTQLTLLKQRQVDIEHQTSELQQRYQATQNESSQAQADLAAGNKCLVQGVAIKQSLTLERENLEKKLLEREQDLKQQRDAVNEAEIAFKTKKERLNLVQESLRRSEQDLKQIERGYQTLQQKVASIESLTDLRAQLVSQKKRQGEISECLSEFQLKIVQIEGEIDLLEHDKSAKNNQLRKVEETSVKLRIAAEKQQVLKQTIEQVIAEGQLNLVTLIEQLPEDLTEQDCETQLNTTSRRIDRMGAINLSAGQAYQSACERSEYLDSQSKDLTSALATLELAMGKIDKETQRRFQETYQEVSQRFNCLFTKLFTGGQAKLTLCGDDLLSAGIIVRAQPPGKKNSTIHALSGGEKAMTAIALVFAIFQINPAPFCILDEVDAPLDDTNVVRLCELLRDISQFVQFIFITHNKITMALAQHLVGVTMRERGVSKIVSVDLDKTLSLA